MPGLDPGRCLVRFHEKGDTGRRQPITPNLATCLVDHAAARGTVLPTGSCATATDTHSPPAPTTHL